MSNADSRSPSTDALDTLGMIHWKTEGRDAIHLAVHQVVADHDLLPGQRIGIIFDSEGVAHAMGEGLEYATGYLDANNQGIVEKAPYHGIVDPFLVRGPKTGERFWFVMKPREVRSLRHV